MVQKAVGDFAVARLQKHWDWTLSLSFECSVFAEAVEEIMAGATSEAMALIFAQQCQVLVLGS